MLNVGLLCCKDERDALEESLPLFAQWFDVIVAQDGSSDGSRELLRGCAAVRKIIPDEDVLRPGERFTDGHRAAGLEWIKAAFGVRDLWVTLLHPDEFPSRNPRIVAWQADSDGATFVLWAEYRYFPHVAEKATWDESEPLQERLAWCAGPWFERRQFKLAAHQVFLPGQNHNVLPVGGAEPPRRWVQVPSYAHYPFRTRAQMAQHLGGLAARMVQPDYEAYMALADAEGFARGLPAPANSPLAQWQNVQQCPRGEIPPTGSLPKWWLDNEIERGEKPAGNVQD